MPDSTLNGSDDFLRRIIDEMPSAVFCKDAGNDFRIVFWNRHAETLWGHKAEDVIGKNDFDFFPRSQADFFRLKDEETLRSMSPVLIPEEEAFGIRGATWVRTRKVPLVLSNPSRRYLLGISEDITAERNMRLELEAQKAAAASAKEMAAIGELAGAIAHEINSPLGALVIQMEILREQSRAPLRQIDAAQIHAAIEMLRKTSTRISEVTQTLSTYASYSRRAKHKHIRPQTILRDALAITREKLRLANVESELLLTEEEVAVNVRPMEILQVVLKLLDQGMETLAQAEKRRLKLMLGKNGNTVEIRVTGGQRLSDDAFAVCDTLVRAHAGNFICQPLTGGADYLISLPSA